MNGKKSKANLRRVLVLINPKSGFRASLDVVLKGIETAWTQRGAIVSYQFSNSIEDGVAKTRQAVADGVDSLVVVGGDGMVNTIGAELVGTNVAMGVIPTGSGNGFARHFNIPLSPVKAAEALASADRRLIDVGTANGRPFFVTCSMAWDATLVRFFEKSPIRGIIPYVFAGAQGLFEFRPQPFDVVLDGSEHIHFREPLVFTVANLTQFGSGVRIAPQARDDDGFLELVAIGRSDLPEVLLGLSRWFDGTFDQLHGVVTRRFSHMRVIRPTAGEMQVDGELVDASAEIEIRLQARALHVLVPAFLVDG